MAFQLDPSLTTVRDLVNEALGESGAFGQGQSPSTNDIDEATSRLQRMLQEWSIDSLVVQRYKTQGVVSNGQQYYRIGPGQTFDTGAGPRPERIASAFIRRNATGSPLGPQDVTYPTPAPITTFLGIGQMAIGVTPIGGASTTQAPTPSPTPPVIAGLGQWSQQADFELMVVQSQAEYNAIRLKNLTAPSEALWYDPQYPHGALFPVPVLVAAQWALFVSWLEPLPWNFLNSATFLTLSPEYYSAIMYNLALRLRSRHRITTWPGDQLPILARATRATLTRGLFQVPKLTMPAEVVGRGVYNIFVDY